MRALEQMDEVQKTSVFGTAVHAVLKPGRGNDGLIRARLEGEGLDVKGIGQVPPSLEDVFLDLVERAGAA
jgi:hypothetical protein